jgi:glycosyltransferase involved in cell wall biosynthesis
MSLVRICHVQVLPLMTGAQRAMLEIFRHVDRSRYELHVACQHPGPMSDELARLGIACHFVPSLRRPIHPWHDSRAARELERLFKQRRFDLVHTHTSKPGILARLAARRAGVPWVIHHVHTFAFHDHTPWLGRQLYPRLEKWAGRYCDLVLFVNHEERELAVRQKLLPAAKCLTIHNGIDLSLYNDAQRGQSRDAFRQRYGIADDESLILFMGRLDDQKQPMILPAIAQALLVRAGGKRWRLVIAGAGPWEKPLQAACAELQASGRVVFAGWQSEPHHAFHAADLLVQPSLWEGLPLTLVEAHAAGLPVVASNIRGHREVITRQTGVLCAPQNPASYADALAALVANQLQRARMGQAAKARAREAFDGDVNMRRIAQLYDEHFFGTAAEPAIRRAA